MKNVLMMTAFLLIGSAASARDTAVSCAVNEFNTVTKKTQTTFVDRYEADRINENAVPTYEVKTSQATFHILVHREANYMAIRGYTGPNLSVEAVASSLEGAVVLQLKYQDTQTIISCN
ncbi:hypothetical protein [Bdellovibrio sp. HCB274]|uniref:hypothetical protein n=1 Tax=Bdellovibrio sp. HCB274 TaxID=3394361 RepID=UPI0039B62692